VPASRVTEALVEDLRRILEANRGKAPVRVALQGDRGKTVLDLPGFAVTPNAAFLSDVKELLGARAIASAE
jgi:hypothetical protein